VEPATRHPPTRQRRRSRRTGTQNPELPRSGSCGVPGIHYAGIPRYLGSRKAAAGRYDAPETRSGRFLDEGRLQVRCPWNSDVSSASLAGTGGRPAPERGL
jgi:hypothetical protein